MATDRGPGHFAIRLKRYREAAGLSQEELAERAGLGRRSISDLERGARRSPYLATVRRLIDALDLAATDRAALLAAARSPGEPSVTEARSSLPIHLSTFIGRETELSTIRRQLENSRLLTLVGPGGIGKTRLAAQLAAELDSSYADGVVFADLAPLTDGVLVPLALAARLGVHEHVASPIVDTLLAALRPRDLLLVLDNCEHLLATVAALADRLLKACPNVRILATSRQGLGLAGETVRIVPPLGLLPAGQTVSMERLLESEAGHLLVVRAGAARSGFRPTEQQASTLAEICRRLDGIPLAIELAAARLRTVGVDQLLERLEDRFRVLSTGSPSSPPRHQTLRATIDWSYALLTPAEQTLCRRLAMFTGGWTLEAAEHVCGFGDLSTPEVLDALGGLVDKSLVVFDDVPELGGRYWQLETLRQYGLDRLAETSEESLLRERHRAWCVSVAEQGERDIWRAGQLVTTRRLELELGNLRAALGWTLSSEVDPEPGLRIAAAMVRFWDMQGVLEEGTGWLSELLALPRVDPRGFSWARATAGLGYLRAIHGDQSAAELLVDESLVVLRELGEPRALAVALFIRGVAVGWPNGDVTRAAPFFAESLALSRYQGPRWTAYFDLFCLGEVARSQHDYEQAHALLTESWELIQAAGDRWGGCYVLWSRALLALAQQDTAQADACARQSLAMARELGYIRGGTFALDALACVAARQGQADRAARLFGCAQALREPIGDFMAATLRVDRELGIAAARAALGATAFEAAWADGRTRSQTQGLDYADTVLQRASRRA
jgi:non-specific serine/threonine protein kinase